MKEYSFVLSVIGIMFSTSVYGASSGSCGAYNEETNTYDDCNWSLDDEGHLKIWGTGRMQDFHHKDENGSVVDDQTPWGTEIKSVEMSGIKSIGGHAFRASDLTEVVIPASVEEIGRAAFQASQISDVTFEEGSTLKTIQTGAFNNIPNLHSLSLPEGVTQISSNFVNYSGIDNLVLPDSIFSVDGVEEAGNVPYFNGLNLRALSNVKNVYCSEASKEKCEAYFNEAEFYDRSKGGYSALKDMANLAIYTSDGDKIYANGKWYNSLNDLGSGNYEKKRIYTIDEANKVSGKKNTFKIRYK